MYRILVLIAVGTVGGFLTLRLPMSGKRALTIAAVPLVGWWYTVISC